MAERQLVRLPSGPAPAAGIASMIPGASAAQVSARPVQAGRVRLNTRAPGVQARVGGVLQDGGQLSQDSVAEARAALQTGAALGDAVVTVGRGISDVARQAIIVREDAALAKADADQRAAFQLFKAQLPADPAGWEESWRMAKESLRESILGDPDGRQSGFLKRKLAQNFEAWEAETGLSLQAMSIAQNRNIAEAEFEYAFNEAIEREDLQTAAEISAQRVASGLASGDMESLRMRDAVKKIEQRQFVRLIETDPWEAEAMLDSANLTPDQRHRAAKAIEGEQKSIEAEKEREEYNQRRKDAQMLDDKLAESPEMPEEQFDSLLESTSLGPSDRKKFKDAWRSEQAPKFEAMLEDDPFRAEREMERGLFPWMTQEDTLKARRAIKHAQHNARIEEMQMLENALAESPNMTANEFDVLASMTHLQPAEKERFRKIWRDGSKPDFDSMAQLRKDVLSLTDKSPIEDVWAMQERINSPEVHPDYRGQFMHLLGNSVADRSSGEAERRFRMGTRIIDSVVEKSRRDASAVLDDLYFDKVKVAAEKELQDWVMAYPEKSEKDMFSFLESMGFKAAQEGGLDAILAPGIYNPPPVDFANPETREQGFQQFFKTAKPRPWWSPIREKEPIGAAYGN